jgi:predicted XRE-type DNA-binding protein
MIDDEPIEIVRGSGNVFRDLGFPDADLRLLKSLLAAEIIKTLDDLGMTVRKAHALTGFAAADFSRVRRSHLDGFTVDRLMAMLNGLGSEVDVSVSFSKKAEAIPVMRP